MNKKMSSSFAFKTLLFGDSSQKVSGVTSTPLQGLVASANRAGSVVLTATHGTWTQNPVSGWEAQTPTNNGQAIVYQPKSPSSKLNTLFEMVTIQWHGNGRRNQVRVTLVRRTSSRALGRDVHACCWRQAKKK